MYRKKTSSWLKHWDFILLDLILLEVSYLLAQWLRHGTAYYREAPLYRNVFFAIAAIDLVVGLMMGSYRGILRRGYWLEAKAVAKHAIIVTVCDCLFVCNERVEQLLTSCHIYIPNHIDLRIIYRKDFVEKMAFQAQRPCIREKSDPSGRWKKEL